MLYELSNLEKYKNDRRLPLVNFIKSIQFVLFIVVISTLIYWLLASLGVVLPVYVVQIFDCINFLSALIVKDFIDLNGSNINLSFGVTTIILLLIIKLLDLLVKIVISLNNQINSGKEKFNKVKEERINQKRYEDYVKEETKNNKILLMVRFGVESTSLNSSNKKSDITSKNVMSDFFGMLEGNLDECKVSFVEDDLFLEFNPFDNIDNFIRRLNNIFKSIEKKYSANRVKVSMFLAADTAAKTSEFQAKQEKLVKLLELAIKNKVVCEESFKNRYALKKFPNWNIQSLGTYNIDGSSTQDVYVMEPTNDD